MSTELISQAVIKKRRKEANDPKRSLGAGFAVAQTCSFRFQPHSDFFGAKTLFFLVYFA